MVAFVASSTGTTTSGVDGTSITITKPSGTLDGHVMVAVVSGYNPVTLTPPSNWVRLNDTAIADSTGLYSWAYYKVASSEGSNYTWTWSGAGGALVGSIATFSGASEVNDWSYSVTSTTDPSSAPTVYPTRTSMGYTVYTWRDDSDNTCTASAGYTERFDTSIKDSGTIRRGMVGYTADATTAANVASTANSVNPTNSVTHGIHWTFMVGDTTTSESWSSTGFGVEMSINSTWTDVTSYVRADSEIQISRGKSSEGGEVNPSSANFVLENTDGRFSPRNPTGPYYGYIGRNTPCRIWKSYGTIAMDTPGQNYDRFRTPPSEPILMAGDLDIRVDCAPESWRQEMFLAGEVEAFASSLGNWAFYIDEDGYLHFAWSTGAVQTGDVKSTLPVPAAIRQTVRATIDVNNGASGNTVSFYTSTSVSGSWTQLGSSVTTSGTTSIATNLVALTIGANEPYNADSRTYAQYKEPFRGRIYAAQLRDGIDGTIVANPDFTIQTPGIYSFKDSVGITWLAHGNVTVGNRRYRFHGEISEWPQRWDSTGTDVYVEVQASGLLRRVQQGTALLNSPMYRYYTNSAGVYTYPGVSSGYYGPYYPAAYWPMEDEPGSSRFASALANGKPMKVSGSPTFADYSGFYASKPLPNITTNSILTATMPSTFSSGAFVVEFLLSAPSGITNGAVIANIRTSGTDVVFELSYPGTDQLTLRTLDTNGTQIQTSGAISVPIAGQLNRITIQGNGTSAKLITQEITATSNTVRATITTSALGRVTSVVLNPNGTMNNVYMGHLAAYDATVDASGQAFQPGNLIAPLTPSPLNAYSGEHAEDRAKRLIEEQGFKSYGIGHVGEEMGYQSYNSFVDALREVEDTDAGYLYEPRNILGLGYRSRTSMYNSPAVLALDYSLFHLAGEMKGDEDDQGIQNDVTVTRINGSSSRYQKSTGDLSIAQIGQYGNSYDLSLQTDDQCDIHAGWRVFLGTVNELRYSSISLELSRSVITADSTISTNALYIDIGDRLTIDNQPSWLPPNQITQQVIGYTETFDNFTHYITYYTVPESPYQIATASTGTTGNTISKTGSSTTTLNGDLTTTATTVNITVTSGSASWTTSGVDFDIEIGGERMTVLSNTGTAFTVTRSVNGVVKTHSSGATVRLFKPAVTAL